MMENSQAQSPKNSSRKRGRKRQNELLNECGKLLINSGKMKDLKRKKEAELTVEQMLKTVDQLR